MMDKARRYIELILSETPREIRLMEVCGTHTVSISRMGIRPLLLPKIRLISGPGCPVCVTAEEDIDKAFQLIDKGATLLTFGDMMRVPSGGETLYHRKSRGADVRVVYSPIDAVRFAKLNPQKLCVFLGVGFETTAPTVAGAMELAFKDKLKNFFVLSLMKTMPIPLRFISSHPDLRVDGFILPGHVSTIIGRKAYEFIAEEFSIPAVISGFEPQDILVNLRELVRLVSSKEARIVNGYRRAVRENGNEDARALLYKYFEPADAIWRGIGLLEGSGLKIRDEFAFMDAEIQFELQRRKIKQVKGCKCGEVILGAKVPTDCPFFGKSCTPLTPLGPCMISSEGTCAAYYKYGS